LGALLAMAILIIYIVLGILHESFIHPITILSGLPSAGSGAAKFFSQAGLCRGFPLRRERRASRFQRQLL